MPQSVESSNRVNPLTPQTPETARDRTIVLLPFVTSTSLRQKISFITKYRRRKKSFKNFKVVRERSRELGQSYTRKACQI